MKVLLNTVCEPRKVRRKTSWHKQDAYSKRTVIICRRKKDNIHTGHGCENKICLTDFFFFSGNKRQIFTLWGKMLVKRDKTFFFSFFFFSIPTCELSIFMCFRTFLKFRISSRLKIPPCLRYTCIPPPQPPGVPIISLLGTHTHTYTHAHTNTHTHTPVSYTHLTLPTRRTV